MPDSGMTITFLPHKMETIQKYVQQGKACLVQGDALIKDDVQRAWNEAAKGDDKPINLLLFTVGSPTATFDLRKGMLILPLNLVIQALLNVFETTPPSDPKFIAITSTGVTKELYRALLLLLRIVYGYLIPQPHRDKRGAEQIFTHVADWPWDERDDVGADILVEDWSHRVCPRGQYKNILVIRPAWLTDGASLADQTPGKQAYRVKDGNMKGAYTISRSDVSHLIVETAVKHWDEWTGRCVSIAY
ncbi:hypothetical protein BDN67DRAFT_1047124 [Paxillus ammoniavirescens]|nr:hypothetical protein BDN67DRAFT_1047124 [Paxillus ammoniavirescens]